MGIEEFGKLAENLAKLAELPSRTTKRVSKDLEEEIQKQFDRGQDPYGKFWKRLRPATIARGRHFPPLTDTRKMRDSIKVTPLPHAGIKIEINEKPAGFHQKGTKKMTDRKIFPERGMPSRWQAVFDEAAQAEFGNIMSGG